MRLKPIFMLLLVAVLKSCAPEITDIDCFDDQIIFVAWKKNLNHEVVWLNRSYELNILKPIGVKKSEVIGTKGERIGGSEFVKTIVKNDSLVVESKRLLMFDEEVPGIGHGISYKHPIYNRFGIMVGTAGIWIIDRKYLENLKLPYEK